MSRFATAIFLVLTLMLSEACSSVRDISVTSCSVESLSPRGLKAVDAVLALGVDNPVFGFNIVRLDGVIRNEERLFASFSAEDISIDGHSCKIYYVPCKGALDRSVSLIELLGLASKRDFHGYFMDIEVQMKLLWMRKTLHFNDLSIEEIVEKQYALEILDQIREELI